MSVNENDFVLFILKKSMASAFDLLTLNLYIFKTNDMKHKHINRDRCVQMQNYKIILFHDFCGRIPSI